MCSSPYVAATVNHGRDARFRIESDSRIHRMYSSVGDDNEEEKSKEKKSDHSVGSSIFRKTKKSV
jgi:hypothetical protein